MEQAARGKSQSKEFVEGPRTKMAEMRMVLVLRVGK